MVVQPSKEAYAALVNEVKALKEEVKRLRNEKKETGRSTAEVELQPKTGEHKARKKSWVDMYNEATALHKHKMLLGHEMEAVDGLEWRVKWAQRGVAVFMLLGVICWFAEQYNASIIVGAFALLFVCILYYKNFSFVIAKRLLREMNVVIIFVFGLCNWIIESARPVNSISPIFGLIYMLIVTALVFLDAVKIKSRVFVIVVVILFVFVNINNTYHHIFGNWSQGVVLLDYSIQGKRYTFMKRSTQRSIFLQVLLFSMSGIYTLFIDRKQELMIFATGNVYRETGTASKEVVEQKTFVRKIESEKKSLSV